MAQCPCSHAACVRIVCRHASSGVPGSTGQHVRLAHVPLTAAPRCRYGVSFFSQLSAVMEYGFGNSAALSILYMEVCARLGLAMHARPVEQGR